MNGDGNVWRKTLTSTTDTLPNGLYQMVIDYVDGFEYHDGTFASYTHPHGRVAPGENGVNCEYFIKDHLGSVRVIYADVDDDDVIDFDTVECELLEEHHYYPFGLEMEGMWSDFRTGQYVNRYTYNGKQAQTEMGWDWLNYGARYYDGMIGRWASVDPLADEYSTMSPYNYAANSPFVFTDPDGREIVIALERNRKGKVTESVSYNNGKLWNTDGSEYKGDNAFATTIKDALNLIRSTDSYAESVVNDLESSDKVHAIAENRQSKDNYVIPMNGTLKDGSKMFLGNLEDHSLSGGEFADAITSLAHELSHAYDYDNGIEFSSSHPLEIEAQKYTGQNYAEIRAVNFENRVRENSGRPMRKIYAGKSIPSGLLKNSCAKIEPDCN